MRSPSTINWLGNRWAKLPVRQRICLVCPASACSSMSLESDLEKNTTQRLHTATSDDSSASWLRKETGNSDAQCTSSHSLAENAADLHALEDFPDGGLRAWLVVLGVRLWFQVCEPMTDYISGFMRSFRYVSHSVPSDHLPGN